MTIGYTISYMNDDLGAGCVVCTDNAVFVEANMTNFESATTQAMYNTIRLLCPLHECIIYSSMWAVNIGNTVIAQNMC